MMVKTDNHNLKAKLDLRRYFLRKYHADGSANVLDCCQGDGIIWSHLRGEFKIANYWGIDIKRKPGRLMIDSARILQQPGWPQNIIDVDTYGHPWSHWISLLPRVSQPITVFMTIGQLSFDGAPLNALCRSALGLPQWKIPRAIGLKLNSLAIGYLLTFATNYAKITEAIEAENNGNARYFGLRLEPIKTEGQQVQTADLPKHKKPKKEVARV